MRSRTAALLVAAAAVLLPLRATADPFGIDVGSSVPALEVLEVAHGDPWPERRRERLVRVIQVFRTWSEACATQSARLDELHRAFGQRGVLVVAVTNEHPDAVKRWVAEHDPAYTVVVEKSDSGRRLGLITGVPTAYVVDVAGHLVWKGNWVQDARDLLPPLLADQRVRVRPRLPESLASLDAILRLQRFARAWTRIAELEAQELDDTARAALAGARRWIESLGEEDLAAARVPKEQQRFYECSVALERVSAEFAGTRAAQTAEDELRELLREPDALVDVKAGRAYHEALAAIEGLSPRKAAAKLRRMMFSHRDTRFGTLAETRTRELEGSDGE